MYIFYDVSFNVKFTDFFVLNVCWKKAESFTNYFGEMLDVLTSLVTISNAPFKYVCELVL